MEISFAQSYAALFILGSACTAFLITFLLYRNAREDMLGKNQKRFLATIRFIAFFLIALLLSGPLIKRLKKNRQKPTIIIAIDNSESMRSNKDLIGEITKQAKGKLDDSQLVFWQFGEEASPSDEFQFNAKHSDYSDLFDKLTEKYLNTNVGAVVLLGDGIFNKGIDPAFKSKQLPFAVYSVGLGDTTLHMDAAIKSVITNQTTFLNNFFPVEINLDFSMVAGHRVKLDIEKKGKIVYSSEITVSSNQYFFSDVINLKAEEPGLNNYRIKLSELDDEENKINNIYDFSILVVSEKQNILLLANGVHPDLAALKNALKNNPSYSIDLITSLKDDIDFKEYGLIIAHQLPNNNRNYASLITKLIQSQQPVLFIIGKETSLPLLNNLQLGIQLQNNHVFENARASVNEQFSAFELDPVIKNVFKELPPLSSPLGEISMKTGFQSLIYQSIQNIKTSNPLVALGTNKKLKKGFIFGEGIWRWRVYDFLQNGNHKQVDEFIQKIVNYLVVNSADDNFNIFCSSIFFENESISMQAQLFNPSNELINTPEVELVITAEDNTNYQFIFDRINQQYRLLAGQLPVGNYSYLGKTTFGDEVLSERGIFRVNPSQDERLETRANFHLLNQIARNTGGEFYPADEISNLYPDLKDDNKIEVKQLKKVVFQDLLDIKSFFLVIIILFSLEWFLRKYWGTY